jgi:hypothetical protein
MKRNDNCIKKTINYHIKRAGEMSNSLFMAFKRLYFDMKINLKNKKINEIGGIDNEVSFNALNKPALQKLIDINITRFKKIPIAEEERALLNQRLKDEYPLSVDTELKSFLKSCGNRLDPKEVEFMIHLIENFESFENGKITYLQLYDIWGAIIHFSTKKPEEIVEFVFDKYFDERNDIETVNKRDSRELNINKVEEFLRWYSEYFTDEQILFVKDECKYMSKDFSRDAFTYMILTPRRYHPY